MDEKQKKSLDMYVDVANILDKHNITYYVACGTLIGAVRHNGFIPWDWDVDLYIFSKDLALVNEVLSKELDSKLYYYHNPTADTHPHVFKKEDNFEDLLRDKKAVYLDLFVLYDYPSKKIRRKIVSSMIFIYSWVTASVIDKIQSRLLHKLLSLIPRASRAIADFVTDSESDEYVVYTTNYYINIFKKSCFEKPIMHDFEGLKVPLPTDWDYVLRYRYGDYMVPPKTDIEKRPTGYPASVYKDYLSETHNSL